MSKLTKACRESGGTLISIKTKSFIPGQNGGCGAMTNVEGTNGGQMPCGAFLTHLDGTTAPYYCCNCKPAWRNHP
jgi:hypothetical protein